MTVEQVMVKVRTMSEAQQEAFLKRAIEILARPVKEDKK